MEAFDQEKDPPALWKTLNAMLAENPPTRQARAVDEAVRPDRDRSGSRRRGAGRGDQEEPRPGSTSSPTRSTAIRWAIGARV